MPKVDPRFLYYFTLSQQFEDQILPLQKGVSYPAVLDREVRAQRIWYPGLTEQQRIVEILEDHLSRLDAGLKAVTQSESRALAMERAAQSRLLSGASASQVLTIGELGRVGTGTTPSRSRRDYYEGGTVPWVTSGDLSQGLVATPKHWVTDLALAETSLRIYPKGSLIVAMYGEGKTRGTVAELGVKATTNQACAVIQLHDPELRPWVRAALEANYQVMRRLAAGGVQPNLNLGLIRGITIPVPEAAERRRQLADLTLVYDSSRRLRSTIAVARSRALALRRAVLAAAFEGKLTGRSADCNVIEEMAERHQEGA